MFSKLTELLPILSFNGQGSNSDKKKHEQFVATMCTLGYTPRQVRRLVEWYMRHELRKS